VTVGHAFATARSLLDPRQPGYLICYVTNRCNFRCGHCFYHAEIAKGRKADELTVQEYETIAQRLGPLVQLSLTGGEPFLRDDFASVARVLIRHTRPRYVTIPTNAWFTDRIADCLSRLLPEFPAISFRLVFSVDGIGSAHDALRGVPGAWERLCASYARMAELRVRLPNLVLDANAAYSARNEEGLRETLATLDRDFAFDNLSITFVRGNPKDPATRPRSQERYRQIVAFLKERERRREKRFFSFLWRAVDDITYESFQRTEFDHAFVSTCVAGRKLVVLGETGEVRPCEILPESAGNVRDHGYRVPAVLASERNRDLLRRIGESRCACGFECALAANAVWSPSSSPRLAWLALRNLFRSGP